MEMACHHSPSRAADCGALVTVWVPSASEMRPVAWACPAGTQVRTSRVTHSPRSDW